MDDDCSTNNSNNKTSNDEPDVAVDTEDFYGNARVSRRSRFEEEQQVRLRASNRPKNSNTGGERSKSRARAVAVLDAFNEIICLCGP
jgi:hypothetical protein